MKTLKRLACAALALTMLMGLTACSGQKFSHKQLCKFAEEQDMERYDKSRKFIEEVTNSSSDCAIYLSEKDKEAQKIYDHFINRTKLFKDYDISESTCIICVGDDEADMIILFTFEDEQTAEKFAKKFADEALEGECDKGDEKGYSYEISVDEMYEGFNKYIGIYVSGKNVLFVNVTTKDEDFMEDFCERMNIVSPSEAG